MPGQSPETVISLEPPAGAETKSTIPPKTPERSTTPEATPIPEKFIHTFKGSEKTVRPETAEDAAAKKMGFELLVRAKLLASGEKGKRMRDMLQKAGMWSVMDPDHPEKDRASGHSATEVAKFIYEHDPQMAKELEEEVGEETHLEELRQMAKFMKERSGGAAFDPTTATREELEDIVRRYTEQDDRQVMGDKPPVGHEDEWEKIKVTTSAGFPMFVWWPKNEEGKKYFLNGLLAKIEASNKPEGTMIDREELQRVAYSIGAMANSRERPELNAIGRELYEEFEARIAYHEVFLGVLNAANIEEVLRATMGGFTAQHEHQLYKNKDIMAWFDYYEQHAGEYLRRWDDRAKIEELWHIAAQDPEWKDKLQDSLEDPTQGAVPNVNNLWAARAADPLWVLTRALDHERLIAGDPSGNLQDALDDPEEKKGIAFLGGTVYGGLYALRRILQFKRFIIQNREIFHTFPQLLDGADMENYGLMNWRIIKAEGHIRRKLYQEAGILGIDEDIKAVMTDREKAILADKEKKCKAKATEITSEIFGGIKKVKGKDGNERWEVMADYEFDWQTGEHITCLDENNKPLGNASKYMKNIQWDRIAEIEAEEEVRAKVDLRSYGAHPLGEWILFCASYPDKAREAMMDEKKGFLRNPSMANLLEFKGLANYVSTISHAKDVFQETVFDNMATLLGRDAAKLIGIRNLSRSELERDSDNMVIEGFIRPSKSEQFKQKIYSIGLPFIEKRIPGIMPLRDLMFLRDSTTFLRGFMLGIWEFIKQSFSGLVPK